MATQHETLVILDYGSQYTQLIARSARELRVHSVIIPFTASVTEIKKHKPLGIVLSGGPNSVYDEGAPTLNTDILHLQIPVLGICYGMQLLAQTLGGAVESSNTREYGNAALTLMTPSSIINESANNETVWMSHGDHVAQAPDGFTITAKSGDIVCAMENQSANIFGLQFHPEVAHSKHGQAILKRFFDLCGFGGDWTANAIINEQVERIKQTVGNANVVCALSGGVDSSIAATLVDRAIGKQQTCIFVDNGLLRLNEYDEVLEMYKDLGLNIVPIRAAERFYAKLKGITDPEQKRKIIGNEFIAIFEEEAKKIPNVQYLVQGTLYPDVIESVPIHGASAVIKSHHNVGGLPEKMQLKLVEPLREVFKDEVRAIGRELGLPTSIVERQAFPGPGLAVRIVSDITPERVAVLQKADAIVREEIEKLPDVRKDLYQYFAVLLPVKSVGVMGDARTYENAAVIKAFTSRDVMTADWARLPYDLIATMSSRIVSEVRGINRVVYEVTTKPPATIEWE